MVCWEFFECGREESGEKAKEHGLCPAYPDHGNSCWFVAGTLCEGEPAGTFAQKIPSSGKNMAHLHFPAG